MVKTTTNVDKGLQREISRKYVISSSICLTLGVFGVLMYVFRNDIFGVNKWSGIFLFFLIPLGIGLLMTFLIVKTKNMTKVDVRTIDYVFTEADVEAVTTRDGVKTDARIAYGDVVKTNLTRNYLFIYLKDEISYPVDLRKMSKPDCAQVKQWLGIADVKKK